MKRQALMLAAVGFGAVVRACDAIMGLKDREAYRGYLAALDPDQDFQEVQDQLVNLAADRARTTSHPLHAVHGAAWAVYLGARSMGDDNAQALAYVRAGLISGWVRNEETARLWLNSRARGGRLDRDEARSFLENMVAW